MYIMPHGCFQDFRVITFISTNKLILLTWAILRIRPSVADSFAFPPPNFASMIRKMPLFLLGIIRRISLIVLKEFHCSFDFNIFDVVEVLFWRVMSLVFSKYSMQTITRVSHAVHEHTVMW